MNDMIDMKEEQFELDNTPDAENLWKAIGGSFSNISQAISEFVDDSISNFRRNWGKATMVRTVRLTLHACGEKVDITVEDGGTGIRNLANAMTLAGQADKETPLNEHGYGLKHALAYVDAKGSGWEVATRTEEDLKHNRCQVVKSPYAIGKGKLNSVYRTGWWPAHLGPTGTMISVSCSMEMLRTLCPEDNEKQKTFWQLVDILEEDLRYTYANILYNGEAEIELVVSDGKTSRQKKLKPLFPQWETGTLQELPVQKYDLGGGSIQIHCRYGSICTEKNNYSHYIRSMDASGVEIRINGRVIEHGLIKQVWGRSIHNSQNAFLAQIDLQTDSWDALPSTKNAKNGFREEDPRLRKLFRWIRANVQLPPSSRETKEQKLLAQLAAKKRAVPGMTRVAQEEGVFRTIGLNERVDLLTAQGGAVTIYEGKASQTKTRDVYQMMMYWHGCVQDGIPVAEAVLIGERHTKAVRRLIQHINGMLGPDGRPYCFRAVTWAEEGITA